MPGNLCTTELPELLAGTAVRAHLKRCHLADPEAIYQTEVLPEIAPDLVEREPMSDVSLDADAGTGRPAPTSRADADDDPRLDQHERDRQRRSPSRTRTLRALDPTRRADARGREPPDVLPGQVLRASSGAPIGHVQAVDGVSFQVPDRRLARPGGGVGLRQVDDRPADHPALQPDRRLDHASRARTSPSSRRGS